MNGLLAERKKEKRKKKEKEKKEGRNSKVLGKQERREPEAHNTKQYGQKQCPKQRNLPIIDENDNKIKH